MNRRMRRDGFRERGVEKTPEGRVRRQKLRAYLAATARWYPPARAIPKTRRAS